MLEDRKVRNFNTDLLLGKKAERFIKELLVAEYPDIEIVEGYEKGFDLVDKITGYKAEVKFDWESRKTDNIAIEYLYKGKKSGISETSAYEWFQVFYFNGSWYVFRCKVSELKSFLKSNFRYLSKVKGGDNLNSNLILVSKKLIMEKFDFWKIK